MRTAIRNRTYRNAFGIDRARGTVKGTDVLRQVFASAFFHARHVVRHARGVPACLQTLLGQAKQAVASTARVLEPTSSSMSGPQRWLAERPASRAFVTSA